MNRGVFYIASGNRYIEEAIMSAESVKLHHPGIPISLFSDRDIFPIPDHIDSVIRIDDPQFGFRDKVVCMKLAPYEFSIFLDTDTYVCQDISEIFELLKHFDLAASHAPFRSVSQLEGIPECFPEFNTGVIAFKKSIHIDHLFQEWLEIYDNDKIELVIETSSTSVPDQPSFRRAVYRSGLRIATLPPEYNCRFATAGYIHGVPMILHGRHMNYTRLNRIFSRHSNARKIYTGEKLIDIKGYRTILETSFYSDKWSRRRVWFQSQVGAFGILKAIRMLLSKLGGQGPVIP